MASSLLFRKSGIAHSWVIWSASSPLCRFRIGSGISLSLEIHLVASPRSIDSGMVVSPLDGPSPLSRLGALDTCFPLPEAVIAVCVTPSPRTGFVLACSRVAERFSLIEPPFHMDAVSYCRQFHSLWNCTYHLGLRSVHQEKTKSRRKLR
jgi:hypothetical protein